MSKLQKKEFNLPEWAFLDAQSHLGDQLTGRTVVYHVRSATVIEILDEIQTSEITFNPGFLYYDFIYTNYYGINEPLRLVVHYSASLNVNKDAEYIIENILKPCAKFYMDYAKWEDDNIQSEDVAQLN